MNCFQLEQEVGKMAGAMMTRNPQIGRDLIGYLKTQLPVEAVADLIIISIERVL